MFDLKWKFRKLIWAFVCPKTKFGIFKTKNGPLAMSLVEGDSTDNYQFTIWNTGIYEKESTEWVEQNIKPGDVVIDVGANVGYYTLLLSKLVGSKGKVFAFEPHPILNKALRYNVRIHGCNNVEIFEKAASDKTGTASFYINWRFSGLSSLRPQPWTGKIIKVPTVRLDELGIDNVRFVKIDAEGADAFVIRGMQKIIENTPDVQILVEFNPEVAGERAYEIFDLLEDFDIAPLDSNLLCTLKRGGQ